MFWIGGLAYNVVGTLVAGATLLCSARRRPARRSTSSSASGRELMNGFAASIAALVARPDVRRRATSRRSGPATSTRCCPTRSGPADPELRHNMLGMTETGSVCLMSRDETDQPEHRRGSFGRPVPGLDAAGRRPRDARGRARPARSASCGSAGPSLMEGYYGRERHEVFTPTAGSAPATCSPSTTTASSTSTVGAAT